MKYKIKFDNFFVCIIYQVSWLWIKYFISSCQNLIKLMSIAYIRLQFISSSYNQGEHVKCNIQLMDKLTHVRVDFLLSYDLKILLGISKCYISKLFKILSSKLITNGKQLTSLYPKDVVQTLAYLPCVISSHFKAQCLYRIKYHTINTNFIFLICSNNLAHLSSRLVFRCMCFWKLLRLRDIYYNNEQK